MTAQIVNLVSRAEAGLRKPRSASTDIAPSRGGVALHYGGPKQRINTHADCVKTWRGWQDYHMDHHGWSDIAYTFGVCDHGYLLAGRGIGVRTAANGTDAGNDAFYAICWIGGEGQTPTKAALDAIEYGIHLLRSAGSGNGAGTAVRPHQWFKGTACPGGALVAAARLLHNTPIVLRPITPPVIPTKESDMYALLRVGGKAEVYGVCPGEFKHIKSPTEFENLVACGLTKNGREVQIVTQAQLDTAKSFVLRASEPV